MRRGTALAACSTLVTIAGCLLEIDRGLLTTAPIDASVRDGEDAVSDVDSGPLDASVPPEKALLASWTFDDAVGNVAVDGSGHGHDAMLSGGARFDDAGTRGGSVSFTGAGEVAMPSLKGPAFPRSGTFAIWMKYNFAVDDPEDRNILDVWQSGRAHILIRRAPGAPAKTFQVAGQGVDSTFAFITPFQAERSAWNHVVVTWDESARSAAVYTNGVRVRQFTLPATFVPDGQLVRLGVAFVGALDEARLYDRALTHTEILALP